MSRALIRVIRNGTMPKRSNADYDTAKSLYLKGISLKDVSTRTGINFGTLRQHAVRKKWSHAKAKTEEIVAQVVTQTAASGAKEHVNTVIDLLGSHLTALKRRDPDKLDLEDFDVATKILDRLDQIGRRAHGIDHDQAARTHTGLVQIVVNGSTAPRVKVIERQTQATNPPTIDVEPDTPQVSDKQAGSNSVD